MNYYHYTNTRIRRQGHHGYKNLKRRRRAQDVLRYLGIFLVFALCYVWTRVQVTETGYRLRRITEEGEKLKEMNHALTVEVATLKSPQHLEKEASRLGLVKPHEAQVVILADRLLTRNSSLGEITPMGGYRGENRDSPPDPSRASGFASARQIKQNHE